MGEERWKMLEFCVTCVWRWGGGWLAVGSAMNRRFTIASSRGRWEIWERKIGQIVASSPRPSSLSSFSHPNKSCGAVEREDGIIIIHKWRLWSIRKSDSGKLTNTQKLVDSKCANIFSSRGRVVVVVVMEKVLRWNLRTYWICKGILRWKEETIWNLVKRITMQFGATFTLFNSAVVAPGMDGQREWNYLEWHDSESIYSHICGWGVGGRYDLVVL